MLIQCSFGLAAKPGRGQQHADVVLVRTLCDTTFGVVVNGLGRHAGEVARLAANTILEQAQGRLLWVAAPDQFCPALVEAFRIADQEVRRFDARCGGTTGATTVAFVHRHETLAVVHFGDCLGFQLRRGAVVSLLHAHSIARALIEAGTITPEEAAQARWRNVVFGLGASQGHMGQVFAPDREHVSVEPGDRFLLCTAGLGNWLEPEEIRETLMRATNPQSAADAFCRVQRGHDDGACLIIGIEAIPELPVSTYSNAVFHLAHALRHGKACADALHDALLEAGDAALAAHFSEPIHPPGCPAVARLLAKPAAEP